MSKVKSVDLDDWTEEQLEAYRMKKQVFDDPMNNFKADEDDP